MCTNHKLSAAKIFFSKIDKNNELIIPFLLILRYLYENDLNMRTCRKLSSRTKELISQSLRKYHSTRPENEKQKTRQKQSIALKQYWQTISDGEPINSDIKTTTKAVGNSAQPKKNITLEKDNL